MFSVEFATTFDIHIYKSSVLCYVFNHQWKCLGTEIAHCEGNPPMIAPVMFLYHRVIVYSNILTADFNENCALQYQIKTQSIAYA